MKNLNTVITYAALIVSNKIWWCSVTNHNWKMMVRLGLVYFKNHCAGIVMYHNGINNPNRINLPSPHP